VNSPGQARSFEDEDEDENEEDGVFTQTLNAALLRLPLRCAVSTPVHEESAIICRRQRFSVGNN